MAPIELTLTAMATAAACSVPGAFLVLRRQALTGDAIGHVILLGIALGFLLGGSLHSPLVVIGAAGVGVVAVAMVEALERSRLVKNDAALGLVYPALFSIGVILVSRMPKDVHFDVDAVLLGDLVHAPLRRFTWGGFDWGPWSMVIMLILFGINVLYMLALYKELKLTTIDSAYASSLGFAPGIVHYSLMALVSLTVVAAFDAAGAVLVVAFLVAPAAIAYLLTDRLWLLLALSVGISLLGAVAGSEIADQFDANVAGSVAGAFGVIFGITMLLSPRHGLIARMLRERRLRADFTRGLLVVHLANHEETAAALEENRADRLSHHLNWTEAKVAHVLASAARAGFIQRDGNMIRLTATGRDQARELAG